MWVESDSWQTFYVKWVDDQESIWTETYEEVDGVRILEGEPLTLVSVQPYPGGLCLLSDGTLF
jgi:hypothetical protein